MRLLEAEGGRSRYDDLIVKKCRKSLRVSTILGVYKAYGCSGTTILSGGSH